MEIEDYRKLLSDEAQATKDSKGPGWELVVPYFQELAGQDTWPGDGMTDDEIRGYVKALRDHAPEIYGARVRRRRGQQ